MEDDACEDDGDCANDSPYCVDGSCYDGSQGDPCDFQADCGDAAPFCSDLANTCEDGMPGSPCAANNDCLGGICDAPNGVCE
jgi:hypothetical protein